MPTELSTGKRYALLAYAAWGLFPLYWKLLKHVPAIEILCHRIFWSLLFLSALKLFQEKKFALIRTDAKTLLLLVLSSLLIGLNWLIYIYAVNTNRIVESSLGYFINPLINVLLGIVFLGERLQKSHKIALTFASLGVLFITVENGGIPWIAVCLAISFSLYGLLRKKAKINSLQGSQLETLILIVPTLFIFSFIKKTDLSAKEFLLLAGSGAITSIPLLWFSEAGKRLPYYMMGFFQYLSPSLQFLTGVIIFKEQMSFTRICGFTLIWIGIASLLSPLNKKRI